MQGAADRLRFRLPSMPEHACLSTRQALHPVLILPTAGAKSDMETLMVLDMGTHVLRNVPGLNLVIQVLGAGLEARARALPTLSAHTAHQASIVILALEEGPAMCSRKPQPPTAILPCSSSTESWALALLVSNA